MKLACVTVTYNEDHLLDKWRDFYTLYKDEIDLHIIVDNASQNSYKSKLYQYFPESIIIEQNRNGGVTAGFNTGIKYALHNKEISFIVLICPDIKFTPGALSIMKDILIRRKDVGISGPLLYDSQNKIIGLGAMLTKYLAPRFIIPENLSLIPEETEVDFVSGGINMINREIFEAIGFQNEKLFMYGDELDFDIRVKQSGFKLIISKNATCFHMHINLNEESVRSRLAYFLFSRNTFILYRAHLHGIDRFNGYLRFYYYAIGTIIYLVKIKKKDRIFAYIHGIWKGLTRENSIPSNYLN